MGHRRRADLTMPTPKHDLGLKHEPHLRNDGSTRVITST